MAFNKRPDYSFVKHLLIPGFGLIANLVCMAFYLIGPFGGLGTKMEPLCALGISAAWGLYGIIYFIRSSQSQRQVGTAYSQVVSFNRTAWPLGGICSNALH